MLKNSDLQFTPNQSCNFKGSQKQQASLSLLELCPGAWEGVMVEWGGSFTGLSQEGFLEGVGLEMTSEKVRTICQSNAGKGMAAESSGT